MRVAIVNDLALARKALERLVLSRPGWSVAWLAEDGAAAVRLARLARPSRMGNGEWGMGNDEKKQGQRPDASSTPHSPFPIPHLPQLVALGASTGGPAALARVLEALPAGFPAAVVVVQHIDVEF